MVLIQVFLLDSQSEGSTIVDHYVRDLAFIMSTSLIKRAMNYRAKFTSLEGPLWVQQGVHQSAKQIKCLVFNIWHQLLITERHLCTLLVQLLQSHEYTLSWRIMAELVLFVVCVSLLWASLACLVLSVRERNWRSFMILTESDQFEVWVTRRL